MFSSKIIPLIASYLVQNFIKCSYISGNVRKSVENEFEKGQTEC